MSSSALRAIEASASILSDESWSRRAMCAACSCGGSEGALEEAR